LIWRKAGTVLRATAGLWAKASKGCSFLKKRTKRHLRPGPSLSGEAEAETDKGFLLLFFKKEDLPFLP
jgi:hypothetical protein